MATTNNTVIDRKFRFLAVNPSNGKIYTHEEGILFLAKDNLIVPMLVNYLDLVCQHKGQTSDEAEAIRLMLDRVADWRDAHPEQCKIPDITGDIERDVLLAPNTPIQHHSV